LHNAPLLLLGAAAVVVVMYSWEAVRRVNHQIQRISTEEHLLQTYTADGWKGARYNYYCRHLLLVTTHLPNCQIV